MRAARLLLGISIIVGALACDEPRASIEIADARAFRTPDQRVGVDVDVVAHEGLGKNIGMYCTRVTFSGQENPAEVCAADLEDGDTKTIRFVSDKWIAPGAGIAIRVRLDRVDVGRSLAAPGS